MIGTCPSPPITPKRCERSVQRADQARTHGIHFVLLDLVGSRELDMGREHNHLSACETGTFDGVISGLSLVRPQE